VSCWLQAGGTRQHGAKALHFMWCHTLHSHLVHRVSTRNVCPPVHLRLFEHPHQANANQWTNIGGLTWQRRHISCGSPAVGGTFSGGQRDEDQDHQCQSKLHSSYMATTVGTLFVFHWQWGLTDGGLKWSIVIVIKIKTLDHWHAHGCN